MLIRHIDAQCGTRISRHALCRYATPHFCPTYFTPYFNPSSSPASLLTSVPTSVLLHPLLRSPYVHHPCFTPYFTPYVLHPLLRDLPQQSASSRNIPQATALFQKLRTYVPQHLTSYKGKSSICRWFSFLRGQIFGVAHGG